jgi:hypothetical protein
MRRFNFHGHKLSLIEYNVETMDCKIVFQCQPGCCTRPYGVKLEISFPDAVDLGRVLADYFELGELVEIEKELRERWTSKISTGT